jgi:SOS-response transcriptional repressor LexA
MHIPVVTGVTAGRGIPDDHTDWEITGFRDVRLIPVAEAGVRFAAVPLEGDSLMKLGILDGDIGIMRITRDYEDGRLGVWQTPHGRTAKFAHYDPDGFVVLHNDNGWRQTWHGDELRLMGIIVRVERDLE